MAEHGWTYLSVPCWRSTDWCVVYIDIAIGGLLVGEAERQGTNVARGEVERVVEPSAGPLRELRG